MKVHKIKGQEVLNYFANNADTLESLGQHPVDELEMQIFVDDENKYTALCLLNKEVITKKPSTRTNKTTFQLSYRVPIGVKQEFDRVCDEHLQNPCKVLEVLMKKYIEEQSKQPPPFKEGS